MFLGYSLFALTVALICLILIRIVRRGLSDGRQFAQSLPPTLPYQARGPLMDAHERAFIELLRAVVPSDAIISCQVGLSALITPSDSKDAARWQAYIGGRRLDFVVTSGATAKIIAVIDLDKPSSETTVQPVYLEFLTKALSSAKIPLLRYHASSLPSRDELKRAISRHAGPHTNDPNFKRRLGATAPAA
jgi:hypothetical protein